MGRLYVLDRQTGTFRIEDDAGHSIQLVIPEEVRGEAAQLVNTRVRAVGRASLDERYRLLSFNVAALEELPELVDQETFFERHELLPPQRPIEQADLTRGVLGDLSDDEIASFMATLEEE
jgi:hypothetical protein